MAAATPPIDLSTADCDETNLRTLLLLETAVHLGGPNMVIGIYVEIKVHRLADLKILGGWGSMYHAYQCLITKSQRYF